MYVKMAKNLLKFATENQKYYLGRLMVSFIKHFLTNSVYYKSYKVDNIEVIHKPCGQIFRHF